MPKKYSAFLISLCFIASLPINPLSAANTFIASSQVRIGLSLEPPHLDPTAGAAEAIDNIVYANIFQGLTQIDAKGQVLPALAKSWKISKDGLIYDFFLKKEVFFHDNTHFNADDVLFSYERARSKDSVNAQKILFDDIEEIIVKTPHHIRITLKKQNSSFLFNLAWGDAVIVNPENADKNKRNPIGTGPFKFEKWKSGQSVHLERNPRYHGKKVPIAKVIFRFIPDPVAAFSAITTNELDAFPIFPAPEQLSRLKKFSDLKIITGTTEGETILAINHRNKFLADKNMRLAISHAINRKDIIQGAMFGYGTPIGSHFAPHNPYYLDLTKSNPYNLKLAKEYLKMTNYAGETFIMKLPPVAYARRSGEIIAAQLRSIGLTIKIENVEWALWLKTVFQGEKYDLSVIAHTEANDINIYARDNYYFGYNNPKFNQIITKIQGAKKKNLKKLYHQAQTILAEDAVNVFLFQLPKIGVLHKELYGFWENSPIQAVNLSNVRWK